jgi:diguanylate cyclase (GGDEF)-like protein/PAS domain S-box-containing protein
MDYGTPDVAVDRIRVLLVEDVASDAALIEAHLRRSALDVELRCVNSETDLRLAIGDFAPHVVVSDFALKGFDGFAALRLTHEMVPHLPFIFLSDNVCVARSTGDEATDFVRKSDLARLVPTIERALRDKAIADGKRLAEAELGASRQWLHDIMDATQEWIWEVDAQRRFTFSNRFAQDRLGYPIAEVIGRHHMDFVHADDQDGVLERWAEISRDGVPTTGLIARWVCRDGGIRWLDCNVSVQRDVDGRVLCYRGAARDITVRRQHEEKIARLTRVNELLSSVNTAIVRGDNRFGLLHEACRLAVEQGGYQFAVVFMIEPGTASVSPSAWWGLDDAATETGPVSLTKDAHCAEMSVISRAMHGGLPVVSSNLLGPALSPAAPRYWLERGIRSVAALPLAIDGTSVGVLNLHSTEVNAFDDEEITCLRKVAGEVSFALQYLRHEDQLQHLSYFDTLTGLANRRLWCERLARKMRSLDLAHSEIAVVAFDLDGLSVINDGCGREVGDQLLQRIGERLKASEGGSERAAYLGSGVFAVFFEGPARLDTLSHLARASVVSLLDEPVVLDDREIRVFARIGASCFLEQGQDAQSLLETAEVALRRAKHDGEHYARYTSRMTTDAAKRLSLEAQLRKSVQDEDFELHYQPIVSARSGRITAVESLLRWRSPDRGLVTAGDFIPLLESTGLIEHVGAWALRRAARDRAAWMAQGLRDIRIAVNVSAAQLRRADFVEIVLSAIGHLSPPEVWLDLEVTESMLMHDVESSMQKLNQLQSSGVHVAIDDFGTGYSSFSRLAALPIGTLKIDRSFVQGVETDPRSVAIVATILALARSLDLNTIAEGIETEQQKTLLSAMGCDELQGYWFARPLCPADCAELMLQRQHSEGGEYGAVRDIAERKVGGRRDNRDANLVR